jgi:uncharacterized membrane protein
MNKFPAYTQAAMHMLRGVFRRDALNRMSSGAAAAASFNVFLIIFQNQRDVLSTTMMVGEL